MNESADRTEVAVVGGSGLYAVAGLESAREVRVPTPYGDPSDAILVGRVDGRPMAFLARHGRRHGLLPTEINYRANIFALKTLGVERIISVSAVGSMRERIHPRDVVVPDQFIDRTLLRPSTFFGDGIVGHIGFADPVCGDLRAALVEAAREEGARVHDGGTYVCMEGPAFSTRAESRLYRSWDVDVIGMTNLQEAKLAREAEICYASLSMATDYDCWHDQEADVSVAELLGNLQANAELAGHVVRRVAADLPRGRDRCGCATALDHAIITPLDAVPQATRERLAPILGRYLASRGSS